MDVPIAAEWEVRMSLAGNSGINCRQREGISTSYTNLRTLRRAIAGLAVSVPAWPVRRKRRLHRPPKQPFDSAGPSIERGPSMSMGRIVAGDRRRHRHARQCGTAASNARVCSRWDADGCQPSTIFQKRRRAADESGSTGSIVHRTALQ